MKVFRSVTSDNATYVKGRQQKPVYLGIYVDEINILAANEYELNEVKSTLSANFKMVDFGAVNIVLGIKVRRDLINGITFIDQEEYAEQVLKRFNMQDCKGVDTPMTTGVKFSKTGIYFLSEGKSDQDSINKMIEVSNKNVEKVEAPYRQAIGSLMYLMTCTRPDLAASIHILSRYMADPTKQHWEGVKRVFRYLKKTKDHGIMYKKMGKLQLTGYCDSDWGGCVDTRRSTSGYVFLMNGACISWSSKRQGSVALSTCVSDFMAGCHAAKEAVWLRNYVSEVFSGKTIETNYFSIENYDATTGIIFSIENELAKISDPSIDIHVATNSTLTGENDEARSIKDREVNNPNLPGENELEKSIEDREAKKSTLTEENELAKSIRDREANIPGGNELAKSLRDREAKFSSENDVATRVANSTSSPEKNAANYHDLSDEPTVIFGDNQSAIELMKNPKFHSRTKHIDINLHFVRELIERNIIKFIYCSTEDQVADSLTKSVPKDKTIFCRTRMGVQKVPEVLKN